MNIALRMLYVILLLYCLITEYVNRTACWAQPSCRYVQSFIPYQLYIVCMLYSIGVRMSAVWILKTIVLNPGATVNKTKIIYRQGKPREILQPFNQLGICL